MARTLKNLYASNSLTASKTEVVAAVTGTKRYLKKATFTNNTGSTVSVDLYIDPDGATEIQLVDTKYLIDTETWSVPGFEGHVLEAAGTIDVTASATGVDLVITGIEIT